LEERHKFAHPGSGKAWKATRLARTCASCGKDRKIKLVSVHEREKMVLGLALLAIQSQLREEWNEANNRVLTLLSEETAASLP
jgi:hypothetical protein